MEALAATPDEQSGTELHDTTLTPDELVFKVLTQGGALREMQEAATITQGECRGPVLEAKTTADVGCATSERPELTPETLDEDCSTLSETTALVHCVITVTNGEHGDALLGE